MSISPLGSIEVPAVRVGSPRIRDSPARRIAFDDRSDRVTFRSGIADSTE
jgi:hypothetical protein